MDALLSVNWIALLVLMIALLSFKALNWIAYRVNWTVVILISMVIGAVMNTATTFFAFIVFPPLFHESKI